MFKSLAIALIAVTAVAMGLSVGSGGTASADADDGKLFCDKSGSSDASFHPLDNMGEFPSLNEAKVGSSANNNPGIPNNYKWPPLATHWDVCVMFGIDGPFPNCDPQVIPFTPLSIGQGDHGTWRLCPIMKSHS